MKNAPLLVLWGALAGAFYSQGNMVLASIFAITCVIHIAKNKG